MIICMMIIYIYIYMFLSFKLVGRSDQVLGGKV